MEHQTHSAPQELHHVPKGVLRGYVVGFVMSIILTLGAYMLVVGGAFTVNETVGAIIALAVAQLVVQVLYFLHMGSEARPRWNTMSFVFTAFIVLALVVGSLWIMANLNYNTMPDGFKGGVISPQTQKGSF